MRTFKYRIYPTKSQVLQLNKQLEVCRTLYNDFLADKKGAWESSKSTISAFDLIKTIPARKKLNSQLKSVYADVLQNLGLRLEKSFKGFFSRVKKGSKPGFPRFKAKNRFRSMIFPRWGSGIKLQGGKLKVSKIGLIKIKLHRILEGSPKTGTLIKSGDNWFVTIVCDKIPNKLLSKTGKMVGVDLGVKTFLVGNDGLSVSNPRFFEYDQKELAKKQRNNVKGNKNRAIRKIYKRVANRRQDFLHKLTNNMVKNYDVVAIENLNVNKMLTKRWCSKQISDAAWTTFASMLEYKAERAGKQVVKVNPAYTSQTCSTCFTTTPHKLKDDIFNCQVCGHSEQRDLNAAKNILALGLQSLGFNLRSPAL